MESICKSVATPWSLGVNTKPKTDRFLIPYPYSTFQCGLESNQCLEALVKEQLPNIESSCLKHGSGKCNILKAKVHCNVIFDPFICVCWGAG